MAEPTLVQIFGTTAIQDATTLTIHKSDLPRLTPSATNTAESLLIAILLQAQSVLNKTSFDSNLNQSVYIEAAFSNFTYRGGDNAAYRTDSLTVNLAKLDTTAVIDPDDY